MKSSKNKLIWHPFTQEHTAPKPIEIEKGEGVYVFDKDGKKYMDLISSWWVNLHGHANETIAKAIYKQAKHLEHVIFAGFTHKPAEILCQKLSTIISPQLNKYFFSDNGSTAVEVALKMSYQYWHNLGEKNRKKFLCFDGAYHGDTFGAMSVGRGSNYHDPFKQLMFDVISLPFPETWTNDENILLKENNTLESLNEILTNQHQNISAMIMEPIIQGASGMRMCRPEFLEKVVKLLRSYGILVIFDEVMTGFGRTGKYFAMDYINEVPDFICLSKGITGGFLPLAMTVTSERIYNSFLSEDFAKAFTHGHSYTANPISCAAAIASFDLLVDSKTKMNMSSINEIHSKKIAELFVKHNGKIDKPRIFGTIAAFNMKNEKLLEEFKTKCTDRNLLIRPIGNKVYLLPPFIITKQELESAYDIIDDLLEKLSIT